MADALFGPARGDWAQDQAQADASARLFKTMGHSKAGEVMAWQQTL